MCRSCKSDLKRRAAVLALAPLLSAAQPLIGHSLTSIAEITGDRDQSSVSMIGDFSSVAYAASADGDDANVKWTCPMHPHYIADEFGTCPICGMDLVKLETGNKSIDASSSAAREVIAIAPEVIQNMGVRLAKAENAQFGRSVRSFGTVTENERLQTEITSRVEGWVEGLTITAVGDEVTEGQSLFMLYSPQLVVAQNDYIGAGRSGIDESGIAQLRSLGVPEKTLKEMRKLKQPLNLVPFYSERAGVVSELNLREGTYVKRGMMMAKIQDYSSVWLIASVAERDLGFITQDTTAQVTFPSLPDLKVKASVDYIYPTVDAKTRTGQVRLVIANPDGLIRPGSYADVAFEVAPEQRLAVPTDAILKSGAGKYVVTSLGKGRFQPRAVTTGLSSGKWTEVKSGLKAGEDIVVSGQFLLDSESSLRESFRKLERLQTPLSLLSLASTEFAMIDHMVDAAIYMHEALVDGYDLDPKFLEPAISIRDMMWPKFKDTQLAYILDDAVAALRSAQRAKTVSETESSLHKLVTALETWIITGAPDHYRERKVAVFRDSASDRLWVQVDGKPVNPYGSGNANQLPWPVAQQNSSPASGISAN